MNIKRAKQEIIDTIEAYLMRDEHGNYVIPTIRQRPVLLIGPPGIGKTQIMEQIARECGIGLVAYTITHHTRQSAIGLPYIEEKHYGGDSCRVTEYTMSEIVAAIYDKMEQTGHHEGILFIDEINCVSETLAPAMLQFLQYKTFGNHRIPEGWLIVTAGNPPEYNKSVREFDVATLDRIKKIEVEADLEAWKEYAYRASVHPAVLAYLSAKPASFNRVETTADGRIFVTPRGWEDLSELICVYERLGKAVDRDVVGQYIQHPKIAKDFANYLELYNHYQKDYPIEEILQGRRLEEAAARTGHAPFDERLSLIGLLLSRLTTAFRETCRQEDSLSQLSEVWRGWQQAVGEGNRPPAEAMEECLAKFEAERERKENGELLTREEAYRYEENSLRLNRALQIFKSCPDAAAGRVREEILLPQSERYERMFDEAAHMLEAAFDFLELAFSESQEMVVFITELNRSYYGVRFLSEYDCERYYRYNRSLLFEDREEALKRKIQAL
jgi:DNA polymerase III delta prime subunit